MSFEWKVSLVVLGVKNGSLSAPAKDEPSKDTDGMILMGVNCDSLKEKIVTSNASCTTNAVSPIISILDKVVGIEKAILNTTHAYTASQSIVDGPNPKDFKEGRAGAFNMVPTSTGAAKSVGKVMDNFKGKFDGISVRVPVIAGSIADVTFIAKRNTTVEEINKVLKDASKDTHWSKVFSITEDLAVSTDILGLPFASIADLGLTKVVDGNLVKVMAWYDNEMGYTYSLVEHVVKTGSFL
jgi:glyceraldehyde 3-phosphate dehydrogenase